jgi:hypothetical protein
MTKRPMLFNVGNTLVRYYQAADFPPILRRSLQRCVEIIGGPAAATVDEGLFRHALALNCERVDFTVWPFGKRLNELFAPLQAGARATAEPVWGVS